MTRETAIEILKELWRTKYPLYLESDIRKALEMAIQSLEQEPKTGHWEWVQYDSNPNIGNWHCSECRTIIPHMPEETDNTPIYKWCPMCGARMVEPQEKRGQINESKDRNI